MMLMMTINDIYDNDNSNRNGDEKGDYIDDSVQAASPAHRLPGPHHLCHELCQKHPKRGHQIQV